MCPVFDEAKKHMTFREVWVGCLLGMLFLIFAIYQESLTDANIIEIMPIQQFWYGVQQNIRTYGGTLTAFLLAVGLPRLICCEHEYQTDCLIKGIIYCSILFRRSICNWHIKSDDELQTFRL